MNINLKSIQIKWNRISNIYKYYMNEMYYINLNGLSH